MKLFLLIFVFINLACKKENSTPSDLNARKFNFDNRRYHSISYSEGKSLLRRKILNRLLEEKIKITKDLTKDQNEESKILADESSQLEMNILKEIPKLKEYQEFKENSAEVFISYADHLDVYFVPTGISRENGLAQLAIVPTAGASFYWINSRDNYLMKGQSYYLISASNQELKENDVYFNSSTVKIGNHFNDTSFNFSNAQVITLKVNIDYFEKETAVNVFQGEKIYCKENALDIEVCSGPCEFSREALTGEFIRKKYDLTKANGLEVLINGSSYSLLDFVPTKDEEGRFLVEIDLKKLVTANKVVVEFRQNEVDQVFNYVSAFNYSKSCLNKVKDQKINFTPILNINLEMMVKGRRIII